MRVMTVTYGAAHVALAIPLIRELQARGVDVLPVALTTAAGVLRREGIPHRRVIDYVDLNDPHVQRLGRRLLDRHHTDGLGISVVESIAYLGRSLYDLVLEIGEQAAMARYEQMGLNAFIPTRFMSEVLDCEQPDVVVATDSPRMERAAFNAAYARQIPSTCIVPVFAHGSIAFLKREDNGNDLCVINERVRRYLIEAGRHPECIHVTGNPASDALFVTDAAHRRKLRRAERGLSDRDVLVLWAEQPEPGNESLPRRVRYELDDICASEQHWKLLVRLHPSSTDPKKEAIPNGALVSSREETLLDALLASDVVITFTSTVAYEALLLNKPVIILQLSCNDRYVDYSEEDGVLLVDSVSRVAIGIRELLTSTPTSRRLETARRNLAGDGNCAARVADLVIQQARTSASSAQKNTTSRVA
jgi:hypothetical protein